VTSWRLPCQKMWDRTALGMFEISSRGPAVTISRKMAGGREVPLTQRGSS
jgi:hypothetical protein